jgi:ADP-ribose pyrophosphatase YjhB (NUDIX family)
MLTETGESNLKDVQSSIGGKAKMSEDKRDAAYREVFEESGLRFDATRLEESGSLPDGKIITTCYKVRANLADLTAKSAEAAAATVAKSKHLKDNKNRKICVCIYGTFDELCEVLIRSNIKKLDDNIIGLAVLPVRTAILIDDQSVMVYDDHKTHKNPKTHKTHKTPKYKKK